MIFRRLAAVTGAVTLSGLVPALPAAAHGAPTTPISRTAACAAGGSDLRSAACRAARAANNAPFGTFDNLRLPNVEDDRARVPDGELCSGGLAAFKGLDVARDDFPATAVRSGQTLRIRYRATIPHAGAFRVYLTRAGYDPARALRWDDLGSKPLVTVTDPPLTGGAYSLSAKLPQRTGRQILYVVWETSSTPDTYYSCSDLSFRPAPTTAAPTQPAAPASTAAAPKPRRTTAAAPAATTKAAVATTTSAPPPRAAALTPVSDDGTVTLGHQILVGAAVVGGGALLWGAIGGMRRRRRENG